MSNAADAAVLALLRAVAGLNVHDGYVTDSDENEHTISAPLPYVVLYSMSPVPEGESRSLVGSAGADELEWQISGVGSTREQAKWALAKARAALADKRLTALPQKPVVRQTDDRFMVRRDDTWTRPGGGPLFFGADRYAACLTV